MRVIDLGAGTNPDPRASETADQHPHPSIDHTFDLEEPWPLADASTQGLIASHVIEHLTEPIHFFQEAHRVLHHDGWLELTYPIGGDRFTDPTHCQYWSHHTAKRFSDPDNQPWDPDTGFGLTSHRVDAWFYPPLEALNPVAGWAAQRWPGTVEQYAHAGEVTARYTPV